MESSRGVKRPPKDISCARCLFSGTVTVDRNGKEPHELMLCNLDPPTPVTTETPEGDLVIISRKPTVNENGFCSHFVDRNTFQTYMEITKGKAAHRKRMEAQNEQ